MDSEKKETAGEGLTDQDKEQLREYLDKVENLIQNEPPYIVEPDERNARAWKRYNDQCKQLDSEYKAVISKALASKYSSTNSGDISHLYPQLAIELLKPLIDTNPKSKDEQTAGNITAKRAKNIEYPVDKVNNNIWNMLEKDTRGQITFKAEKTGSKKQLDIFYAIDFDALNDTGVTITKRLTAFDKRVYIAISALYNAGNSVISLTQIYYAMGNTKKPDTKARDKIHESITKMATAKIYVDNSQEAQTYNYPSFVYEGVLLPMERVTEEVNGKVTESAIHIFREPPLVSFAKQRKQVTTVDVKLLQSPISKTEENLSIDDYLIERITRAKTGNQPARILYNKICEKANITAERQKRRLPDKVKRYLDYYKTCNLISDYKQDKDGVTIIFPKKP